MGQEGRSKGSWGAAAAPGGVRTPRRPVPGTDAGCDRRAARGGCQRDGDATVEPRRLRQGGAALPGGGTARGPRRGRRRHRGPASALPDSPPAAAPQDSSTPPARRRRDALRAAGAAGSLLPGQRVGPPRAAATPRGRARVTEPQVSADPWSGSDVTSSVRGRGLGSLVDNYLWTAWKVRARAVLSLLW